jgi:glycosyltransferase involved in cell wall biosynthesis
LYPFRLRKEVKPKILWVRAFHEIYNPQLAVRVFRRIADAYPEATCCMVGPDKDGSMETCKKLAESFGLKINFTGRLDKTEWIRLADGYDIFLNTTDVDNTPVSVMEAMALGMPVVTTDAGGIPNLFEPGVEGIMTPVNNEDKMTEAIFSLILNPERAASISASARAKARSWDWNVIGPQWKALLDEA